MKKIPEPANDLISVAEYQKLKGITHKQSIYNRLKTPETPNGDITPELDDNNRWVISWKKYKDLVFPTKTRRTKIKP